MGGIKRYMLLLPVLAMLFCGCSKKTITGSNTAEVSAPWAGIDLQLCATTGKGGMAETENGYYAMLNGMLCYADKEDLSVWTSVCNRPNCDHDSEECCALAGLAKFILEDNRIMTIQDAGNLEYGKKDGYAVYSMTMDGTGRNLEFMIDGGATSNGLFASNDVRDGVFYTFFSTMLKDGTYRNMYVRSDSHGSYMMSDVIADQDLSMILERTPSGMRGDYAVYDYALNPDAATGKDLYRLTGEEPERIPDVQQYELFGAYLRGDKLYHYESNEGFLVTDLACNEIKSLYSASLTDGHGVFFTEQFMVETNLYWKTCPEEPAVRVYDGAQWREVILPEDFVYGEDATFFPYALSTEHMFFTVYHDGTNYLYCIALDDAACTMTLCSKF